MEVDFIEKDIDSTSDVIDDFILDIEKESVFEVSLDYLSHKLQKKWNNLPEKLGLYYKKFFISDFFLENLYQEHLALFDTLGKKEHNTAAICFTDVFSIDNPELALTVHESLSDLFGLIDLKHAYEDHKFLYIKREGRAYNEWKNGIGVISPHQDDLYENRRVDFYP